MKFTKFFILGIIYNILYYSNPTLSMHFREEDITIDFAMREDNNNNMNQILSKHKNDLLKSKVRSRMKILKEIANGKEILN